MFIPVLQTACASVGFLIKELEERGVRKHVESSLAEQSWSLKGSEEERRVRKQEV